RPAFEIAAHTGNLGRPPAETLHNSESLPTIDMPDETSPGSRFCEGEMLAGRHRILAFIATRGMGGDYKAEATRLHRPVALKFLPPSVAHDDQSLLRFQREAQAASGLAHPNICTIFDISEHDGSAFIAMEYLEGVTLGRKMAGRPLDIPLVLDL